MVHRYPGQGESGFFPRGNSWNNGDRSFLSGDIPEEGRFQPSQAATHPRVLPVEAALRDYAGIAVREFALFVIDEQGNEKTYSSASLVPYQQRIFSGRFRQEFSRSSRRASETYSSSSTSQTRNRSELGEEYYQSHSASSSAEERRRIHRQVRPVESDSEGSSGKRKRSRVHGDSGAPVPAQKMQYLAIGDTEKVTEFYYQRMRDLQQWACKVMGKAFVKLVEPKKQTHYPYTKGEARAPAWWPLDGGPEKVRHREPDHLYKKERVRLLVHILGMIVLPYEQQCERVRALGTPTAKLNVARLEEVTMEVMNPWFNDGKDGKNLLKRPFLKEIFKVAKQQERYLNGEIDATTRIPIQIEQQGGVEMSDDEAEKDDEDEQEAITTPHSTLVSPSIIPNQSMMSTAESDFQPQRPLPLRYNGPPIDTQPTFSEPSYIPRTVTYQSVSPSPHDAARRNYTSPTFNNTAQGMYGWNQPMASNGPSASYYAASPHSIPHSAPFQLPPPQPMLHTPIPPSLPHPLHHFDLNAAGPRYDTIAPAGTQGRIPMNSNGPVNNTGPVGNNGLPEYYHENAYASN